MRMFYNLAGIFDPRLRAAWQEVIMGAVTPSMATVAGTLAEIDPEAGATPAGHYGIAFATENDDGTRSVYAAIIGEIESATPGAEEGRLHFLVNDGGFLQVIGTINKDGALIWGPGAPSFVMEIAGEQTINGVPGPGALFGERHSVQDPDYIDCRPYAIRNIKITDLTSLDYRVGQGFSILNSAGVERPVGTFRYQYVNRTAGSETTRAYLALLKGNSEKNGPYWEMSTSAQETAAGAVPMQYASKAYMLDKTSDYTLDREDSGKILTNTGAKAKIVLTLPNLATHGSGWHARVHTGLTPVSNVSGLKWTASAGDPGAYYLVTTADGNPGFSDPTALYGQGTRLTKATVGSLGANEWGYGNADTLGFNTIYLQVGADPDGLSTVYNVTYPIRVTAGNSADAIFFTGTQTSDNKYAIDSDGIRGTTLEFFSYSYQANLRGWEGTVSGTWTKV